VLVGVNGRLPEDATGPMPLLIETEAAPFTLHIKEAVSPAIIVPGEMVNSIIAGRAEEGLTVIVAEAVTVPTELIAVKT
jgi:hypothetical protein